MTESTQSSTTTETTTATTSTPENGGQQTTTTGGESKQVFTLQTDTTAGGQQADTTTGGQSQDTTQGGQQTDTTPGGDTKEGGDQKPVEYTDFSLPDGYSAIPEQMEWVKEFGKQHGLTQEAAQSVVDKYVSLQQGQLATWENIKGEWATESRNDETYGGKNLEQSQQRANQVIDKFGDETLVSDLIELGLGNKLSVMRFLNKVYAATADDNIGSKQQAEGGETASQGFASIWAGEHKK